MTLRVAEDRSGHYAEAFLRLSKILLRNGAILCTYASRTGYVARGVHAQLAEKRPLFALTWIRRTLCFEDTFHSCQRCLQAIEAIIQIFGQKSVFMGHYYQLYRDQENTGFKQEAVAETLDEKSDDEQNKRCDDNELRYDVEMS
jgi:hypothetical protein